MALTVHCPHSSGLTSAEAVRCAQCNFGPRPLADVKGRARVICWSGNERELRSSRTGRMRE